MKGCENVSMGPDLLGEFYLEIVVFLVHMFIDFSKDLRRFKE